MTREPHEEPHKKSRLLGLIGFSERAVSYSAALTSMATFAPVSEVRGEG